MDGFSLDYNENKFLTFSGCECFVLDGWMDGWIREENV